MRFIKNTLFKPRTGSLRSRVAAASVSATVAAVVFSMPLLVGNGSSGEAVFLQSSASAQEERREPPATRSSQQLTRRVSDRLLEAQELMEVEDYDGALAVMGEIREMYNQGRLNDREIFTMWQFYGSIAQSQENFEQTLEYFQEILALENILTPQQLEQTLLQVGALHTALEQFAEAVEVLTRYIEVAEVENPDAYFRLAVAHYQLEQYREAIDPTLRYMELTRQGGEHPNETAYGLLQSAYMINEDWESALDVIREKIVLFDDTDDWTLWAGLQGQLEMFDSQTNTYYVNYVADHLETESEIMTLAAQLFNSNNPFDAAQVIQAGIDEGIVNETEDNLSFLGQAYQAAREYNLAVAPLEQAAELSEGGELYSRLAIVHTFRYDYESAVEAFENALDKGDLNRPDQTYLSLANAYYQLNRFDEGIEAATAAGRDERSADSAETWVRSLQAGKRRYEALNRQREQFAAFFR